MHSDNFLLKLYEKSISTRNFRFLKKENLRNNKLILICGLQVSTGQLIP